MKMKLKQDTGERAYPIWLFINPKHPSVRHNIWSPILDEIQDRVYREIQTRIDTTNIFIRNAVSDCRLVPNTLHWWGSEVAKEIEEFREIVFKHQPKVLISFGAFPFEFLRRVFEIKPEKGPKYWGNSRLTDEFERSIESFDVKKINRIPLLRRVIANDNYIEAQNCFGRKNGGNYYSNVGAKIADKIIENKDSLDIWIK